MAEDANDGQESIFSSWINYLKTFFYETKTSETLPKYPIRPNRYAWYQWWHGQDCYTNEELKLLDRIKGKYKALSAHKQEAIFNLEKKTVWNGWLADCEKPTALNHFEDTYSFTLPSREAKDTNFRPVADLAEEAARQIANWQAKRIENQMPESMNDPSMLAFAEFRDYFSHYLSELTCRKEELAPLIERQSYARSIIHIVPSFGPDRLFLYKIQDYLQQATQIISNCVANKQLPGMLSDSISRFKDLENLIGTILHFILINKKVLPNFSLDATNPNQDDCHLSPLCTVNKNARSNSNELPANQFLGKFDEFNKFYRIENFSENENQIQFNMKLKDNLLKNIVFANFVTQKDKQNYLEAIVALQSLINVRKTLQGFEEIQANFGNYIFAHYIYKSNALSQNSEALIDKSQNLLEELIHTANNGLKFTLENPNETGNEAFGKNIRALDTLFAQGTTTNKQLEAACQKAKDSMRIYQDEIRRLATHLSSGKASYELSDALQNLIQQINYINSFLPAQLEQKEFVLDKNQKPAISDGVNNSSTKEITMTIPAINGNTSEKPLVESAVLEPTYTHFSHTLVENSQKTSAGFFQSAAEQIKFAIWDSHIKKNPITGKRIYTLRIYSDSKEIGLAEFYDKPGLCKSQDGKQNNIIKLEGVLKNVEITDQTSVSEVCQSLPPTLFDKILFSAEQGAMNGAFLGGSNVLGATLRARGMSPQVTNFCKQLSYYTCVYAMNFMHYWLQREDEEAFAHAVNSACQAGLDTGMLGAINAALSGVTHLIDKASEKLKGDWALLGKGIKALSSPILGFSIFSYNTYQTSFAEASASFAAGKAAQKGVEFVARKLSR